MRTATFGLTKQVLKSRVARYHFASIKVLVNFFQDDTLSVARNNLVFSVLSIFRVEGSVTLKMLNLFIVNQ